MLQVSVAAMAAAVGGCAQIGSSARTHEAITQTDLPYFPSPQDASGLPLGHFATGEHVCLTGQTYSWHGLNFFQYVLPSGQLVYTSVGRGIFAYAPEGSRNCISQVASINLPDTIPAPSQIDAPPGQSNGSGSAPVTANSSQQGRAAAKQKMDAEEEAAKQAAKQEMVKSTVPYLPDPHLKDPEGDRTALSYLKRQLTISVNMVGDPEPGLASLQSINGGLCHLRCGFHLAVGIGQGGVLDSEVEFALSDINIDTIRYNKDAIGRAFLSFDTSDGTPRFSRRDREMDMKQKVLSPWSEWAGVDKGSCRAKGDKDSLERDMKALAYLAKSCGAKESPF